MGIRRRAIHALSVLLHDSVRGNMARKTIALDRMSRMLEPRTGPVQGKLPEAVDVNERPAMSDANGAALSRTRAAGR